LIEIGQPGLPVPQVEGEAACAGGALQAGGYGGHRHRLDRLGTEMSKAFTKESDGDDADDLPEDVGGLPVSAKNYMTPEGFARLREELNTLLRQERPEVVKVVTWAAGNGDRSENGDYIYGKKRLREIDRRVRFLSKRLEIAEVVDPQRQKNRDQVFFGASVTYADARGAERTVTIVGIDEVDLDQGQVSWISPIARALIKAQEGDIVELRTPAGTERIEIVEIRYRGDGAPE
jgi:transcription elongation factor GreB